MERREKPRAMEISENDLWILSYYRESELAGALIMGRLARETDDDDLRVHLTEHCAEEANHAWLWTKTIVEGELRFSAASATISIAASLRSSR